ncbi:hypothetical protein ADILRU_0336 [Leifsonia rubra CMS 76R]|nr:hypothetical protein ADILRU_0336 [Leifsonia rubra CMS 76R]
MLPERQLEVLEQYATWSQIHLRLSGLIQSGKRLSASDLGDLAWLRVFDPEDLQEFSDELHSSLIMGLSDKDLGPVEETVSAWRVTARQLEDPLRRSVLLGTHDDVEFEEVTAPKEDA